MSVNSFEDYPLSWRPELNKDEDRMGLRYADIHRYIREGSCGDPETDEKIRKRERANMHKRRMPVIVNPFGGCGE